MKKRILILIICLFYLASLQLVVEAQTNPTHYYVSSVHPARSDSNAGTSQDQPWATLHKAAGAVTQGHAIIHLDRGSNWPTPANLGSLIITHGGQDESSRIVWTGADWNSGFGTDVKPKIELNLGGSAIMQIKNTASYLTFTDIEFDGNDQHGWGIVITTFANKESESQYQSHITLRNLDIHDIGVTTQGDQYYAVGIFIKPYYQDMEYFLVENNRLWDIRNHFITTYPQTLGGGVKNSVFRNNVMHDMKDINSGARYFVQIVPRNSANNIWEYNTIYGYGTIGFAIDSGPENLREENLIIRYNLIYGLHHNNPLVQSNAFWVWAPGGGFSANIYGNIVYGNDGQAFKADSTSGANINLYNNIFYNNNQKRPGSPEVSINDPDVTIDNFKNNIIVPSSGGVALKVNAGKINSQSNNLLYGPNGNTAGALPFKNPIQPPTKFVNSKPSPDGLTYLANSPAIDKGTELIYPFDKDIAGVSRPQGSGWDIGAYEFTGTVSEKKCVLDLNGDICTQDETCSGSWLSASDTNRCCSQTCITQTILQNPGDTNNDKIVNLLDILLIIKDFGKTSDFDERADANGDEVINLLDILEVVKNWGREY